MSPTSSHQVDPVLRAAFRSLTAEQQQGFRDGDPSADRELKTVWLRLRAYGNPFPNRATRRRAAKKGR